MRAEDQKQEYHLEEPKDSEFHLRKIPVPRAALTDKKNSCQSRSLSPAQLSDARVERVWN